MEVTDTSRIINITPKYPDIMSDDACDKLRSLYEEIISDKKELSALKQKAIELEQIIDKKNKAYTKIASMFDIEFGKKNITEIKNEVTLGIINREDYRNKH